jgi:hypothetical protein
VATPVYSPEFHRGLPRWTEVFVADVRSLAALRIVLALTVLADVLTRVTNLRVHYTDEGLLPRRVLIDQLDSWQISLALMNGTPLFQALVFIATAAAAIAMLVGYRTRLAVVAVWVLVLSIQWRNPFLSSSGDDLLRLLLFWSVFLPLGDYWSVDRLRSTPPERSSTRVLSLATAGLFLQIAYMYWFTLILKSGQEWRVDFTALYYALSIEDLTSPIGAYVLQFPTLLKALTITTLGIELVATILLFCPIYTGPVRTAAVAAIMAFHAGIWLMMTIGFFPWVSASCMVCFLPSWFWDSLVPRLRAAFPKISRTVDATQHVAMRLAAGVWASLGPRLASLVNVRRLTIASIPASTSRGRTDSVAPAMPEAERTPLTLPARQGIKRSSLALNVTAGFLLVFVTIWNLASVAPVAMAADARALGSFFGLSQYWIMFAPYPFRSTSWYVIPGTLADGRQIDLLPFVLREDPRLFKEVEWEKPEDVRGNLNREERWRKYFEVLASGDYPDLLLPFGQYICRSWNATYEGTPSQLETFDIVVNWQQNFEDYQRGPPQQQVLWSHFCYAQAP